MGDAYLPDWNLLPEHIMVSILLHLDMPDRSRASCTCQNWHTAFQSQYLWSQFKFIFNRPEDNIRTCAVDKFGQHMQHVSIYLNQKEETNRTAACQVLNKLSLFPPACKKLKSLTIKFIGENPVFYSGRELMDSLETVFLSNVIGPGLVRVDLSGFNVAYDDDLLNALAAQNRNLEFLNLQNNQLVCNISRDCITNLVTLCRKLRDIRIFNCALSHETLEELASGKRTPLQHLGVKYHREEKYVKDISSAAWQVLVDKTPSVRMSLLFDYTCEIHKIAGAMKPEIPVKELRLECYTKVHQEVLQCAHYYCETLQKLVVFSRPCKELDDAILEISRRCKSLRALHVFSVLNTETIAQVFQDHPNILEEGLYTLKNWLAPSPWASEEHLSR